MGKTLDQVFMYKMGQRVAFEDTFVKRIGFGVIQNRHIEDGLKVYTIKSDIFIKVNQSDIIGFIKERKV